MKRNLAFIDGQNLHMGTAKLSGQSWRVDSVKLREYLRNKYKVDIAYYFLGCLDENFQKMYTELQEAGFVLMFREHNSAMIGKKKGNVDADIIFEIMRKLYKKEKFEKVVLVSGDGDYKKLVDFLIEENKFHKILFPNRKFRSSLYKELGNEYLVYLDDTGVKKKIERTKKERSALGN
jgi:uncharacterized LabA/DUF88 family protein